jgi:hypothetical protein
MPIHKHLVQGSHKGSGAPRLSVDAYCVHCFHNLGAMRSDAQRVKTVANHLCPEKLLSMQPAAPPPYN